MIGPRIKEYRLKKGLKLKQLAGIIGISHGSLSDIENQKTKPSSDTIIGLVEHTDISPAWLLTGEGSIIEVVEEKPLQVCEEAVIYNVSDPEIAEINRLLKEFPQDKALVLKLLKGKKDIKEALEGFEISKIKEQEG